MIVPTTKNLQDLLAEIDHDFVQAERPGEDEDQGIAATMEWILRRVRALYQVTEGTPDATKVDALTRQKMLGWDSDDPKMFTVEKILRRLAQGRGKSAMTLIHNLQEKAQKVSEEMRRRASVPREEHPVNELIEKFVREDPNISEKILLRKLEAEAGGDVISAITDGGMIEPFDTDYPPLKVGGLRSRLSRIKRKISR